MNHKNNSDDISIEISDELKETVDELDVDSNLNIIVRLKGNYKTIISGIEFKKGLKRRVIDWEKTKTVIESNLKLIESHVATKISLLVSQHYQTINNFVNSVIEDEEEDKTKDKSSKEVKVFKYYSEKDRKLYESIVLAGNPCFLSFENGEFSITEKISENTRSLIPFGIEDSPAKPYEFSSIEEIKRASQKNKVLKVGDLYKKIKSVVRKYIDQNDVVINIITIDILVSYFQDRLPTTHYLFFMGNNGVGKSVIGELMEILGYRGVKMTDPSSANIFRLLGKIQPGQCTLIMDEVERIDNNVEIMNILKTGYSIGGKVPKINTTTYDQEFFNTYSFKMFLSERLPNAHSARGFLDRTFAIPCVIGTPDENIKDVLLTQRNRGNQYLKDLNDEIMDLRKDLFIYRLIFEYDGRPPIKTGLKNRDKELCEGLALFFGSEVQKEVELTFQHLLDAKYEQKELSFDYFLLTLVIRLLETSEDKSTISIRDLWNAILASNNYTQNSDNSITLDNYGFKLYYNQLSTRSRVFGAEIKHTNKGNMLVFKDSSKILEAYQQYNTRPQIKCSLVMRGEGGEGGEGSIERTYENGDEKNTEPIEPLSTNT